MGKENSEQTENNKIRAYKEIALVYNHLMRAIDYKGWAKYIYYLYEHAEVEGKSILEIGAGTGLVAKHLSRKEVDLVLSDLSNDMLNYDHSNNLTKVCCDMRYLPFKMKFDFIFSTFDSVNYLLEESQIVLLFKSIKGILKKEGCFAFDVSLEKNSIKYEKSLNRKGVHNGIKYVQTSNYDRVNRIHTNNFKITLKDGNVVEEVHKQKIYHIYDYFRIIDDCGFYVLECFDGFSFDDVKERSERAQFLIKRKS